MKKQLLLALISMLTLGAAGAENLLVNSDFSDSSLKGWRSPKKGRKVVHYVQDGKMIATGDTANKYNYNLVLLQDVPVKLETGKRYLLTVKARSNIKNVTKQQSRVRIRAINAAGSTLRYYGVDLDLKRSDLQTLYFIYTPAAQAGAHQIYVETDFLNNDETVEFTEVSLGALPAAAESGDNLVKNGDFSSYMLEPYTAPQTGKNNRFYMIEGDNDDPCLAVSGDRKFRYPNSSLIQKLPKLEAGKTYRLSGRVKAGLSNVDNKEFYLQIRQSDGKNVTINYISAKADLSRSGWQEYSVVVRPHPAAENFELYVSAHQLETGDKVFVDDLKLVEI